MTLEIPKGQSRKVDIVKPGFRTERRVLMGDADRTETVTLEERAAKTADTPSDVDPEGEIKPSWMR
jgi:hypothetical protein